MSTDDQTATLWRWSGDSWDEETLGGRGMIGFGVSADASIVVGGHRMSDGGFVWTENGGYRTADEFLSEVGITPDPNVRILGLTAISDDGSTIVGVGQESSYPWGYMSFIITLSVALPGDVDGDGDVDLADLATLLSAYGTCDGDPSYDPAADLDDSGCVDLGDLATLLANYGAGG